ncbi:MAG: acyltransferase [Bacteroidales bacterium]|nr:acyltransferase [Bacteroidales bacterium]
MKQRNHTFDLLCGICIIRMIVLHITDTCGFGKAEWWTEVMAWTYYFMSFFFFKAGYFNKTISGNSRQYCIDKAKRLLVPYLTWGLIGNIVHFTFVWFILDPKSTVVKMTTWEHVWQTSSFFGNSPTWFLFSFFWAYIAMHFISKVRGLRWVVLAFPMISWWLYTEGNPLWLSLNNVFFGIFLFFLGRVWRWLMERMGSKLTLTVSVLLIGVFVWLNATWHGQYTMSANTWNGNCWIIVASTVTSLCGISGLLIKLHTPLIPVINYIGEHSMVFFVAHYPILQLYKLIRTANVRSLRGHWDDYTILLMLIFGVCFLLVPYVEKVPWLSGRWPKKPKFLAEDDSSSQKIS